MSAARDLAQLGNQNAIKVDTTTVRLGINSTTPDSTLDVGGNAEISGVSTFSGNTHVGTGITMYASAGIVSATSYDGDGSRLTGISAGAWESLTSGSWTSGTTKDITTTHLTSSHQLYRLTFHFHLDDAGESGAGLRVYTGGAWQSSGYTNRYLADDLSAVQTNRNRFPFGASATMMRECMGTVQFAYPEETGHVCLMHGEGTTNNDSADTFTEVILFKNGGGYNTAGAITGLQFFSDSQAATWGWYVLEGCAIS